MHCGPKASRASRALLASDARPYLARDVATPVFCRRSVGHPEQSNGLEPRAVIFKIRIRCQGDIQPIRELASAQKAFYPSESMFWWKPQPDDWYDFSFTDRLLAEAFAAQLISQGFSSEDIKRPEKPKLRPATGDDHTDILAVLENVADEIPVSLGTAEKERLREIIGECCASGDSMVAEDEAGTIVGVVLARPDALERLYRRNGAVSLDYIGVAKSARQSGIFAGLMATYLTKGVPLIATVLAGNKGGMLRRLTKLGFAKVEEEGKQTKLKFEPQSNDTSSR